MDIIYRLLSGLNTTLTNLGRNRHTTQMAQIGARVQCGAHALDLKVSGWWMQIDENKLDISNLHQCMLGQLYKYAVNAPDDLWSPQKRVKYGFMEPFTTGFDTRSYYKALTLEWLRIIRARKSAALDAASAAFFIT